MHTRTLAFVIAGAGLLAGCGGEQRAPGDSTAAAASTGAVDLTGAGATFPYPIYSKWFRDYAATTGVKINYQSIGSGGGIQQLLAGTVDFGASDGPMSDDEMARAKGGKVLHFPTVLGLVVVTYNLPELTQPLRLTGEVVADIFLGTIKTWKDARIASINPGVKLPSSDILVVHRSDGSGTTYVFTDYLTAVSSAWKSGPARGKEVQWPTGLGAKGNEAVAGQVKQTPSAIGYVELAYAKQNKLQVALVRNAAGQYVEPSTASVTTAAEGVIANLAPETDYRVSIVNAPGANSYPISSFTYLLVYENQPDPTKGKKLVDFMRWMYSTGQQSAASLDYAPLPPALAQRLTDRLQTIRIATTQ
jgi:phosphate transport system substrate-binding protein